MNKYNDLELAILSCVLIKPKLIEELVVEDKHFIKNQRLWQFMKAFYKKFGTFDITLMYSVCKDKWQIINNITWLVECECTCKNFEKYQKQLIDLYEEAKMNKWIVEKVYQSANDLYLRNINPIEFKERIEEIYKNAKELYGGDENA